MTIDWLAWATLIVPTLAVLITAIWQSRAITRLDEKNEKAHEGIAARIDRVDADAERRDEAQRHALELQRTTLDTAMRQVTSWLAGKPNVTLAACSERTSRERADRHLA